MTLGSIHVNLRTLKHAIIVMGLCFQSRPYWVRLALGPFFVCGLCDFLHYGYWVHNTRGITLIRCICLGPSRLLGFPSRVLGFAAKAIWDGSHCIQETPGRGWVMRHTSKLQTGAGDIISRRSQEPNTSTHFSFCSNHCTCELTNR